MPVDAWEDSKPPDPDNQGMRGVGRVAWEVALVKEGENIPVLRPEAPQGEEDSCVTQSGGDCVADHVTVSVGITNAVAVEELSAWRDPQFGLESDLGERISERVKRPVEDIADSGYEGDLGRLYQGVGEFSGNVRTHSDFTDEVAGDGLERRATETTDLAEVRAW